MRPTRSSGSRYGSRWQLGSDVWDLVQVQDADDGVADCGPGLVSAAGVLAEADITDLVMHFYAPVAAQVRQQVIGAGLVRARPVMPRTATALSRFPSVS